MASGCTSSTVTFHATGTGPPLWEDASTGAKTVIYWGTAWRTDQKEDRLARSHHFEGQSTEDFFRTTPCFSVQTISRTIDGRDVLLLGDKEVIASVPADVERVHILRFEELGPVLVFYLSPILWTSDLDIQLRVRTLNARTGSLESDTTMRWRKGGPFNLRGTGGLPEDLAGTLGAVFLGYPSP